MSWITAATISGIIASPVTSPSIRETQLAALVREHVAAGVKGREETQALLPPGWRATGRE